MLNSLRCRLRTYMHNGLLNEKDVTRLIKGLDVVDAQCDRCEHYNIGGHYCKKAGPDKWKLPPWAKCNNFEKRGTANAEQSEV